PRRPRLRGTRYLEPLLALDLLQVAHDLDGPETAVPAESPDGGDLAGPGPARDGLRVDPEHLGHLGRRQKGIGVGTVLHRLSSLGWTGPRRPPRGGAGVRFAPRVRDRTVLGR